MRKGLGKIRKIKKKHIFLALLAVIVLGGLAKAYSAWVGTTRIAFLNYQAIALGQISHANDNAMIKLSEITTDDFDHLDDYDMIIVNGMGLRIDENQRKQLEEASYKVPTLTHAATNPANNIVSVDNFDADYLMQYIENGGKKNYQSMLAYIRKFIDGKKFMAPEPERVNERPDYLLTHFDPKDEKGDELGFNSIREYNAFLAKNGLYKEGAPTIMLTGFMGAAPDMEKAFEKKGFMVYRINKLQSFIAGHHADSIQANAVVNMAHGRLGDYFVEFLKQKNIPLFSPLNINRLTTDWENDKQGMNGGFMSQSIVTPEIDGAIRPYVVFGQRINKEGLQEVYGIPDRMESFVESVQGYVNLKNKKNSNKRIAIFYFKGPGQNALTASGMEVVPSLYNLLVRLKNEGYNVGKLPANPQELAKMIQAQGAVFGTYAEGAYTKFLQSGHPALVTAQQFAGWTQKALSKKMIKEMNQLYGSFPGKYMATDDGKLAVARLQFGNVALLPQVMAGVGGDSFKIVHGTDQAPPYTYVASYLWARYGFSADALIHFGTHGSLEYTPRKQVALGSNDWSDRLIGVVPHLYIYTIGNVGEAMIAKRRTYAQTQSYLTPPFKESELRQTYKQLSDAIQSYEKKASAEQSLKVKALTVKMGIARELGLDAKLMTKPYSADEIARVENYAEELANEKITGKLYTLGVPYDNDDVRTSVYAMATDPIAYGMLAVDKLKGRAQEGVEKHKQLFDRLYLSKARNTVTQLLGSASVSDEYICRYVGITPAELQMARKVEAMQAAPDPIQMMMQMADQMGGAKEAKPKRVDHRTVSELRAAKVSHKKKIPQMSREAFEKMEQTGRFPDKMMEAIKKGQKWYQDDLKKAKMAKAGKGKASQKSSKDKGMMMSKAPKYTRQQIHLAQAITTVEHALQNVGKYSEALRQSPLNEMSSLMNALNGGFTAPSPGGDLIVNPNTLPTGRNLFSINVENTPSEDAWEKAKELCDNTIKMYCERHKGEYPRKVSYTLWSSEFIETEGATIAQILYMLGVEPVRDAFGRVTDLRLIPSKQLGRPRIDVVVQTSGQLRDLAASRLFLINRAIEMAANAKGDKYDNLVKAGVTESERVLVEKGMSPKEAREVSMYRVFGGVNGNYGTGIQEMVTAGDRWDKESQIAEVYMNNMGAYYGDEKNWETVRKAAFEAALTRTDVVVQPRQSNTWGALSLDHVYEFMGGMNLAVRNVTGKDPDAYLADYRNHSNMRMQEVKEAIGIESRTTIFNPAYIKEKMKGGASSASTFAEIVTNTYGWNVMKPKAIDKEMWDEIYNVYVKDKYHLGTKEFFDKQNPAALMEMTAVMMESARKGMWKATPQQLKDIAKLHTETVNKYKPSCSGFVCDNAKLRNYIASKTDAASAKEYQQNVEQIRDAEAAKNSSDKGMVMKKETLNEDAQKTTTVVSGIVVGVIVIVAFVMLAILIRRRRKNMVE
ncbi:cobaltochelatase subunit CobN [Prevotella copri]|uniref:Cobaltochelatase subunit CobN n=1 Tax=Segatella copri TaxID=165179 RepID=A0AAW5IHK7_9BACT|nr:cobaltochelatase subunit CobN [Segatella copri]MCP9534581.1 cobaltochelatase subunit CobN [Segatella copri]MCP9537261.1 cobaltochelatase subunit CobN [Segatella copri]MCP9540218.1 cobaltochelatase subunit CobN [Segatella copri]MCP9558522.1 cobaltochelatase subunit CobN [Segatella copri]MCP9561327.1 cobaltochelatase subunit CobN [Segatella copri]